ncbi:MAG: helix-turn-helix domain-containing protein, partial [bacterium]|nr:helix-turn-helix domain-containing protein [bacterium]
QELADRSGVAASTVHKIEKNQTVPTISVLLKICAALRRRPDELLAEEEPEIAATVQRKEERLVVGSEECSAIEQLTNGIANSTIDVWRVAHKPGAGSGPSGRTLSYKGELVVLCEAGELTFELDGAEHTIGAGDSLHYKTDMPHRWFNSGSERATALFFGTIPKGLPGSPEERREKLERAVRARGVVMYNGDAGPVPSK